MKGAYLLLKKRGLLFGLGLGVLFLAICLIPAMGAPDVNAKVLAAEHSGSFDPSIWSIYVLTGLAAGLSAAFAIRGLFMNIKKSYKVFIAAAAILAIYLITSFMGNGDIAPEVQRKFPDMQGDTIQMVEGIIFMFYTMLFLGVAAALFSSVRGLFSR